MFLQSLTKRDISLIRFFFTPVLNFKSQKLIFLSSIWGSILTFCSSKSLTWILEFEENVGFRILSQIWGEIFMRLKKTQTSTKTSFSILILLIITFVKVFSSISGRATEKNPFLVNLDLYDLLLFRYFLFLCFSFILLMKRLVSSLITSFLWEHEFFFNSLSLFFSNWVMKTASEPDTQILSCCLRVESDSG